jgi:uncharacterized protein (DUF1810 family)
VVHFPADCWLGP